MLKHYKVLASGTGDTTITVSGTTYQVYNLVTVPSGYELAITGTRITGGDSGGEVHFIITSGVTSFYVGYSVAAGDVLLIDQKEFYEAGEVVKVYTNDVGIGVEMFGSLDEVV